VWAWVAHVLLAAERPAGGYQLDGDTPGIDSQHRGDLVAVVPYPLATRVHVKPVIGGYGESRLGFHEGMLDALGLEDLLDHVGRAGQGRLYVAPGVGGDGQHVAIQFPHSVLVGLQGHYGVAVDGPRNLLNGH